MPKTAKRIGIYNNVKDDNISGIGILDTDDIFCRSSVSGAPAGSLYAQNIANTFSLPLVLYDPSVSGYDLSSALSSSVANPCILFLPAGSYTINTLQNSTYGSAAFPIGNYSVIGIHPEEVLIVANSSNQAPRADGGLASWEPSGNLSLNLGYFTIKTTSFSPTTYENCLFHGTGSGNLNYITMKNVAVNRANTDFSLIYDNNGDTSPIRIQNCSFLNASNFGTRFSGSDTNKTITNSIFNKSIPATPGFTLTNCSNNVAFTLDGNFVKYVAASYPTAGHLYNLNATSYTSPV